MAVFIQLWDENGSVGIVGEGGGALDKVSSHHGQFGLGFQAEGRQLGEVQVRIPTLDEFQGGPCAGPRRGALPGLEAAAARLQLVGSLAGSAEYWDVWPEGG